MTQHSFTQLQLVFDQLASNALQQPRNDILSHTLRRIISRAADSLFDTLAAAEHFNTKQDAEVARGRSSRTKVLLLKPVGDHCNLRCSYCYESLRLAHSKEKVMKTEHLERYLQHLLGHNSGITDLFLHGGEPLLAGKAFFYALIAMLKAMHLYGKVNLGVQTNATLLDQEWIDFFKAHNFRVGISIDGDKEIHDKYRVDHRGRGSYDEVLRGIRLMQANDLVFGVICIVSAETAKIRGGAARIFQHLVSLGLEYIDIHPAFTPAETSGYSAEDNINATLYTQFMTELSQAWLNCPNPYVQLRCIEDIFENLSAVKSSSCYASGLCTSILGMDPSGAVVPCTRPFHSQYTFGNAGSQHLDAIEQLASYQQFLQDEAQGRAKAAQCQWSGLCGSGGCPHERFSNGRQDPAGRHIYCTCSAENSAQTGYPGYYQNLSKLLEEQLAIRTGAVRSATA